MARVRYCLCSGCNVSVVGCVLITLLLCILPLANLSGPASAVDSFVALELLHGRELVALVDQSLAALARVLQGADALTAEVQVRALHFVVKPPLTASISLASVHPVLAS